MRWTSQITQLHDVKTRRRFAWFPLREVHNYKFQDRVVWLEWVTERRVYTLVAGYDGLVPGWALSDRIVPSPGLR